MGGELAHLALGGVATDTIHLWAPHRRRKAEAAPTVVAHHHIAHSEALLQAWRPSSDLILHASSLLSTWQGQVQGRLDVSVGVGTPLYRQAETVHGVCPGVRLLQPPQRFLSKQTTDRQADRAL